MKALFAGGLLVAGSAWAQEAPRPPDMELGVSVGAAFSGKDVEGESHRGVGARLHLLKHLGRYFSVGPEAAIYAKAGSEMDVTFDGGQHSYNLVNKPLFQVGGLARLGIDLGGFRPAALFGVSYNHGSVVNLGYSVGAELEVRPVEWLPLSADVRVHRNLYNYTRETDEQQQYVTLGVGWRMRW
ncbi:MULTISPECIES: outer membrane beta-barrel protein [Myxococcus]|uniref:outer membrane beta-barrel protein n=1 Tax=Myxococcus TaxID=32 RepID=UPI0013D48D11|nr:MULTISPECIES: outer membrane beta-barrel protein [Myxococcus]NVJ22522.1 outer membrane beta-barrel protein [Myxococcus sp. AM011]